MLYLEGVHCSACVWLVERLPRLLPGVVEVRLDLPRSQALIVWDPGAVTLSAVARRLDSLGYAPHPCRGLEAQAVRRREDRAMLARIGVAGAAAGNVMAIAFALYGGMLDGMEPEFAALFRWASFLVALPAMVWGGGVFFKGAWTGLRAGALVMDLPISLGLLAGFLHGAVNTARGGGEVYFDSVTALIFLLLVGRYLQRRQQRAAADAAELIASLAPSRARLIEGGQAREVPLEALVPGVLVEVRAGDLVPADGVIVSGRSILDVSLLSGESRPVTVRPGERIHAGTLNLASRLEMRVEGAGEDTRVGRLMKLVEEHARRRAPIVQLADRISGHFVAVVLVLAAATLGLWLWLDPARAVDHAVAVLIVTCPCALGLATPLAMSAAIGQAARRGLLIKGADVLEKLTRPGHMWLDKTGTLTAGRATLVRWAGDESVKPLVAAAEAHSSHPLARAFVAALGEPAPATAVEITETHGAGIEGRAEGRRVVVGSPAFVASRVEAIPSALSRAVEAFTAEWLTPVLIAVDGEVVAAAGFGDPLREDAAPALARVRALGWRPGRARGGDRRHRGAGWSGSGPGRGRCLRHAPGRGARRRAARRGPPHDAGREAQPRHLADLQRRRRVARHGGAAEPAGGGGADAGELADGDHELVPGADLPRTRRRGVGAMSVMYILLPVALLLAGAALLVFIWAARAGQFDDLETPALRILHEDAEVSAPADRSEAR